MPNEDSHAFCPSCHGPMIRVEDQWEQCPNCGLGSRPFRPSEEERAETRAAFQQWRHLLLVVADLHNQGYECARIVPFIADTAGGGEWRCVIAPAAMVSPSHGARIAEHLDWWGGTCPAGTGFPYLIGREVRRLRRLPQGLDSAENMIATYPKLAEHCLGPDGDYAQWYRAMLRTTPSEAVVYAQAYWDDRKNPPTNGMRVLGPAGQLDTLVPLPPPGAASAVSRSGGAGEQVAQ